MTQTPASTPWPAQACALIRRRYAHLATADLFHPDPRTTAIANGCPEAWYDSLPARVAGAYSGCGWPAANLDFETVRIVVEVGCGGGLVARFIAERLSPGGRVIALDLTPKILLRARETASDTIPGYVRLLAADMERLPLADGCADAVIANASLNLATDKDAALGETHRILRSDGVLLEADLVRVGEMPREIRNDPMVMATSLGGVTEEAALETALRDAGYGDIRIGGHRPFGPVIAVDIRAWKKTR